MTNAQKIINWLAEHPNSLLPEIDKGINFAGVASYLGYLTKNGTLVRTGEKTKWRYRVAEESDHPPAQSNGVHGEVMNSDVHKPEAISVVLIEFAYYNTTTTSEKHQVFFWLPGNLLWSSQGLAQMFEITRSAWLDTKDGIHDAEEWGTWHLVAIHEEEDGVDNQIVVNVDWTSLRGNK